MADSNTNYCSIVIIIKLKLRYINYGKHNNVASFVKIEWINSFAIATQ